MARSARHAPALTLSDRERQVLALLRAERTLTRSALIRRSGLSGTAVFRATEELAAAGLVIIGEPRAEGRGQPSHTVTINGDAAYTLGLSVMTDLAEILLMNLAGDCVHSQVLDDGNLSREVVAAQVDAFIDDVVAGEGRADLRIQSIGVAVAGYFVGEGDKLNPSPHLDDWALVHLREQLEPRLGLPVTIENIANASAMGEQLLGQGQHHGSFAYINVASGFGGGIIQHGQLWRGVHGNAGEFAAVLRAAGQPIPNLETLRDAIGAAGVSTRNVRDMIDRFDMDWPGVADWLDCHDRVFALLTQIVHYTVDIDAVVLGGRLPAPLASALAARVDALVDTMRLPARRDVGLPMPRILPAAVSSSAAAVGAAAIPLAQQFYGASLRPSGG